MPRSSELPDDLKELAHRNALPIDDRFHPDVDYLIAVIEKLLSAAISAPPESKMERKAEEPFPAAQPETKPQPGTEIKEPAPTPAPAAQPR